MKSAAWLGLLLYLFTRSDGRFPNPYPKLHSIEPKHDAGNPLILTPFIESGNIAQGRSLARVPFTDKLGVQSYSGYFTVNKKFGSNLFFWYFPALMKNNQNAPVVLWLQGGPGATSLYGLFTENGPIKVKKSKFARRKYTWALNHHLIYIDNPVGTGFSYTGSDDGYAKNETVVGRDLYQAMSQFFKLFPNLSSNEFFVTGESYGGKYVPALSYTIHQMNKVSKDYINLKGFAIGNGYSDPVNQLNYADYIYQLGLIDTAQHRLFKDYQDKGIAYIKAKKWADAFAVFDDLLDGDLNGGNSLFFNTTGFKYYFNYLHTHDTIDTDVFAKLLQSSEIRRQIHVGNMPFNNGTLVEMKLVEDISQSVAPWVAELLSYYRGLIYNGQLDIIVAYPLTENYLKNLNFSSSADYQKAQRHIWRVDGEVAGYVKTAGNLTELLVRNAGHMVPSDQPKWAMDLISRFTYKKPFF